MTSKSGKSVGSTSAHVSSQLKTLQNQETKAQEKTQETKGRRESQDLIMQVLMGMREMKEDIKEVREIKYDIKEIKTTETKILRDTGKLTDEVKSLKGSMNTVQEQLTKGKLEVKKMKEGKRKGEEIVTLEEQVKALQKENKEMRTNYLQQQLDQSMFMIRIQNFPEKRREDIRLEIGHWLEEEMEQRTDMEQEVDSIYRVSLN